MQQDKKNFFSFIETASVTSLICILLFTGFVLYLRALFNNFVWDDNPQIVTNTIIRQVSNLPLLFTGSTFNAWGVKDLIGLYYKPLMPTLYLFDYALWGYNPFGFHIPNLLFHFTNTILIFFIICNLFRREKLFLPQTVGFLCSLLFLVHPANVESVAYISSSEPLYFIFVLLALVPVVFLPTEKLSKKMIILSQIANLAALLSKESGALGVVLVLTFVILYHKKKIRFTVIASVGTFAAYFFLRMGVAHLFTSFGQPSIPIQMAPLAQRLMTIPYEVMSYMRILFFPKDLYTSQDDVVRSIQDPRFYLLLPWTILLGIFFIVSPFIKNIRSRLFFFFYIWTVVGVGMYLNIVPLDMTIAERWLYGPFMGILGLLMLLIERIFQSRRKVLIILLVILFCSLPVLAIRSYVRIGQWQSDLTLFNHDIQYEKESAGLYDSYGVNLVGQGKKAEAIAAFKKSIELFRLQSTAYDNLGIVYFNDGKISQAKYYLILALQHEEGFTPYENYAQFLMETKDPGALSFTLSALRSLPNDDVLNTFAAQLYIQKGDNKDALIYAERLYQLDPTVDNATLVRELEGQ